MNLPLLLAALAERPTTPGDEAVAIFGFFVLLILAFIFGSILKVCIFPKKKITVEEEALDRYSPN